MVDEILLRKDGKSSAEGVKTEEICASNNKDVRKLKCANCNLCYKPFVPILVPNINRSQVIDIRCEDGEQQVEWRVAVTGLRQSQGYDLLCHVRG